MSERPRSILFIAALIAITGIGPFAMQMFLPSLPAIQEAFAVTPGVAQLVFSASLAAIAVMTLAFGPLSDRYGRRPPLLTGMAVFIAGSAMCAWAPSIELLILGRVIQAAGGAAGLVLARAIVRDLYDKDESAVVIAYLTVGMVAAPMVAPAIGGVVTDVLGWRYVFAFLGVVGVLVTALVLLRLGETLGERAPVGGVGGMLKGFARLLRSPAFCGYTFQSTFAMAAFFSFLSGAPYVMIRLMGRPASEYGLYFMLVAGCFMVGNFISARRSRRFGLDRMIVVGSALALAATGGLLALMAGGLWTPLALFVPTMAMALGNGLSIPNSLAGAVSVDPRLAGAASGLAGFLQMMVSAVAAQAVGSLQNGTPYPMAVFMVAGSLLSLLAILLPQSRLARAQG